MMLRKKFSAEQVVTALYLGVLGRLPDQHVLRYHANRLNDGSLSLHDVAMGLNQSDEHRASQTGDALRDVTQFGELRHLLDIFMRIGVANATIVDVGARGIKGSNCYNLLHDFGWNGVLIEANPRLIDTIQQEFAGLAINLINCAIGARDGVMPFYIGVNDDVSSLLASHAEAWGPIRDQVNITVRRLGDVLSECEVSKKFDILSLDIEGMDVDVLNDLIETTPYRPRVVVIEASFDFRTKSITETGLGSAVQRHYRLVRQTRANLILVAADETAGLPVFKGHKAAEALA